MTADPPRRHGHIAWIAPLLALPVIFFGLLFVAGVLLNNDDPVSAWLWTVPYAGAFVGSAAALVLAVVALARVVSRGRDGARERLHARLAREDAARRGLTPDEYGVYKGSVGSAVEPVNSAGGLLIISIILTALAGFILVLIGVMTAQAAGLIDRTPGDTELSPVMWFFVLLALATAPVSWRYYAVERRAQKLRLSRGLPANLERERRSQS